MNVVRDAVYWVRRTLLGVYGPATQDPKNDPVEELKRGHNSEVRADGEVPTEPAEPPVDDATAAGWEQGRANTGDQPDADPRGR